MMLSHETTDYTVPGTDLQVAMAMTLARQDISGQTSGTDTVTTGNKGKKLSVSVHIRFDQAQQLRGLTGVAEAVDATGKPLIYTIADPLAESLDIRQVEFTDQLRVSVLSGKQAWVVRFALRQRFSVPEQREQRSQQPKVVATTTAGEAVTLEATQAQDVQTLTGFEQILKAVDQLLAPSGESS